MNDSENDSMEVKAKRSTIKLLHNEASLSKPLSKKKMKKLEARLLKKNKNLNVLLHFVFA